METRNTSRTFIIGAIASIAVAAALGVGFLFGQGSSEPEPSARTAEGAQVNGQRSDGSPASAGTSQSPDEQLAATSTPTAEDDTPTETPDDDEPTATPTATATPTGQCAYCLDGDLAAEPTPVDPCPLCNDLPLAIPVDTPPVISDISTSFCFPMLVVKFDLDDADYVWFSFGVDGISHQSQHIDADTFLGFLSMDVGYLSWGVYSISNLRVHATDEQGHHVWSDQIDVPEPNLAC